MKFRRTTRATRRDNQTRAGFTFAEVLAALLFMAIVIPTAVEGVRIANLAGQVSARKSVATRIARNYLTELKVSGQWQSGAQNGSVQEGAIEYRWIAQLEPWTQINRSTGTLRVLTVRVQFLVQGREYEVRVSTLIDTAIT
jgi:Tfp pilus assembly protein PilV